MFNRSAQRNQASPEVEHFPPGWCETITGNPGQNPSGTDHLSNRIAA